MQVAAKEKDPVNSDRKRQMTASSGHMYKCTYIIHAYSLSLTHTQSFFKSTVVSTKKSQLCKVQRISVVERPVTHRTFVSYPLHKAQGPSWKTGGKTVRARGWGGTRVKLCPLDTTGLLHPYTQRPWLPAYTQASQHSSTKCERVHEPILKSYGQLVQAFLKNVVGQSHFSGSIWEHKLELTDH